jgi:Domain of unknown function (DUF5655)/Domain of unknown function (DUF4287)
MASKNLYSVHPGILMMEQWVKTLPEKTGKSLDQWVRLITRDGPGTTDERKAWLKREHNLGTNIASSLVEEAEGRGENAKTYLKAAPGYVDAMFAGPKARLRPILDELLGFGFSLGDDVRVSPGKTIIPFYRNHVFAQVKPTTQKRVDLGLCLKGEKPSGKLVSTGGESKGDRITHRIELGSPREIDQEVRRWMSKAYDLDA